MAPSASISYSVLKTWLKLLIIVIFFLPSLQGNAAYWRDFHTAVPIGQYMFIFGGRSDRNGQWFSDNEFYSNKLEVFDTKTKTWSDPETWKSVPVGRRSHSACEFL